MKDFITNWFGVECERYIYNSDKKRFLFISTDNVTGLERVTHEGMCDSYCVNRGFRLEDIELDIKPFIFTNVKHVSQDSEGNEAIEWKPSRHLNRIGVIAQHLNSEAVLYGEGSDKFIFHLKREVRNSTKILIEL